MVPQWPGLPTVLLAPGAQEEGQTGAAFQELPCACSECLALISWNLLQETAVLDAPATSEKYGQAWQGALHVALKKRGCHAIAA